jgi:hypothetical protein
MAALLLEGRLPYLGSWDQNFPGVLLVHVPQILLFGRSQLAFHIWDMLLQLVGAYYLFRLALRFGGREAAILAPILSAFYYVQQGLWMAGERDTYVSILLLAAVYNITNIYSLRKRALLSGLLVGLAMLFRPTYGVLLLPFVVYLIGLHEKKEGINVVSGAILPVLGLTLVYVLAGGLRQLFDATILFNTQVYIGQGSVFSVWEPIRFYFPVIPFAVAGMWVLAQRDRSFAFLIGLSFVACAASVVLLYRHSVYHYHPAMTIFLLVSAIGIGRALQLLASKLHTRSLRLAVTGAGIVMTLLFFSIQTLRGNTIKSVLFDLFAGKIYSLDEAYRHYEGSPDFGVHIQKTVGDYLNSHTLPGEPVQMFGPYSYPQYYSRTSTASRFQTLHALTMRKSGDPLTQMQQSWRQEYLSDLQRVRPKYFIVCDAPEAFRQFYGGRLGHEILREDMVEVGEWLRQNYLPDTVIGAFTIYRSNAAR